MGNLGFDRGRCARAAPVAKKSSYEERHTGLRSLRCVRDWREPIVLRRRPTKASRLKPFFLAETKEQSATNALRFAHSPGKPIEPKES